MGGRSIRTGWSGPLLQKKFLLLRYSAPLRGICSEKLFNTGKGGGRMTPEEFSHYARQFGDTVYRVALNA